MSDPKKMMMEAMSGMDAEERRSMLQEMLDDVDEDAADDGADEDLEDGTSTTDALRVEIRRRRPGMTIRNDSSVARLSGMLEQIVKMDETHAHSAGEDVGGGGKPKTAADHEESAHTAAKAARDLHNEMDNTRSASRAKEIVGRASALAKTARVSAKKAGTASAQKAADHATKHHADLRQAAKQKVQP